MSLDQPDYHHSYQHLPPTVFGVGIALLTSGTMASTPIGALVTVAIFIAATQMIALWAVLGPASYLTNCAWSLVALAVVGSGTLFGCFVGTGGSGALITLVDLFKLIAFGPVIWCIAQLPCWLVRLMLNWRIVGDDENLTCEKVSLRDLMIYTLAFALSLACLEFVKTPGNNFTGVTTSALVMNFLIPITICFLISFFIVCVPAIKLLLSPSASRKTLLQFAWLQIVLIAILISFGAFLSQHLFFLPHSIQDFEVTLHRRPIDLSC